eukprot:TRINITY_DN42247_c0_g3_i1.p1 TRINITY_DN42247_c0_g3~~TRINITY_DN42247_c0_g3_i1.p1  ORF type:complete len:638 (-),score=60.52 TRINITY_DN42247_c0_g3_i1:258-2171(-)
MEQLSDLEKVALVSSMLRRLEYTSDEAPYFGRIALYPFRWRPSNARRLTNRALIDALPDHRRLASRRTVEKEVAEWSSDDVECALQCYSGRGYHKHGGIPDSPDEASRLGSLFTDGNLHDTLVVLILGMNDESVDEESTRTGMRRYVQFLRNLGCKVALIEANDWHSTNVPWVGQYAQELHQGDPDNVFYLPTFKWSRDSCTSSADFKRMDTLKFPFPAEGWSEDGRHLDRAGLRDWLPVVRELVKELAQRLGCRKVLLVSDSSFQAHDYINPGCVLVRTYDGATSTFSISFTSTIAELKALIAQSGFARPGLQAEEMWLSVYGRPRNYLEDSMILKDCVKDGTILYLQFDGCNEAYSGPEAEPGTSPLSFYLPEDFTGEAREKDTGVFRIPLTGDRGMPENGPLCYLSAGYRQGNTLTAESWQRRGIAGCTDANLALVYSCPVEFEWRGVVRRYDAVLECVVSAGRWDKLDGPFGNVPDKNNLYPTALIVRYVQGSASPTSQWSAPNDLSEHWRLGPPASLAPTPTTRCSSSYPSRSQPAHAVTNNCSKKNEKASSSTARSNTDQLREIISKKLTFLLRQQNGGRWVNLEEAYHCAAPLSDDRDLVQSVIDNSNKDGVKRFEVDKVRMMVRTTPRP